KPATNGVAIALQEARNAAFEFGKTIDADIDKINQLLKSNSLGFWAGLATGSIGNEDVQKNFQAQYRNSVMPKILAMDEAARNMKSTDQADPTHQAYIAARAAVNDAMQGIIDSAYQSIDAAKNRHDQALRSGSFGLGGLVSAYESRSPQAVIDANRDVINMMKQAQQQLQLMGAVSSTEGQIKAKQAILDSSREFNAEQKRQAAEQMQASREALEQEKADHDMTLADEASFWISRAATNRSGALGFRAAIDEANKAIAQQRAQNMRARDTFDRIAGQPMEYDLSKESQPFISSQSQEQVQFLRNLNQSAVQRQQMADALAELSVRQAAAQGQMTELNAARAMAALHTDQYARELDALQAKLAEVQSDPALRIEDRNSQISALQDQIDQLNGNRVIQQVRDQAAQNSPVVRAMNEWVKAATDLPQHFADALTEGLNSINSGLSTSLLGKPHETGREYRQGISNALAGSARGIGSGLLNDVLRQGEGGLLKMLGFGGAGKPDGSQALPFWVRNASSVPGTGGGGGFAGGLPFGLHLPGMGNEWGSTTQQSASGRGGFGGLLRSVVGMFHPGGGSSSGGASGDGGFGDDTDTGFDIPFFAGGGDVLANHPAIVGEQGPELFMPSSAGRIIPNDQLGGGGDTHVHVDARGSSNPAETEMAVHRAMRAYLPQMGSIAVAAVQNQRQRTPLSRR
ncbi:MAG TPA: hypothetical protein VMU69_23760, partial [Bradyrhizobium sp.]|nr:hypothetical protein [Bradyrhizobium sp.]